jgi:vitamin B12 transporter
MKALIVVMAGVVPGVMVAQTAVNLPAVTVYSPRIANQSPAGTFAMPVSALRYEPRVDIHARNLAEGQADVTLRGGIFENTAFQLGALTVTDPQTGHYFAELPVAPAFLNAPEVFTGAELTLRATNATVGAVSYGWRPVRTTGAASAAIGEHGFRRAEIYQGFATKGAARAPRFGVDVAIARSESDGSIPFGEHEFDRVNVRLQRADATSQTDLFAGYQGKRFGWPNMYTPFNSNETENLQTVLFAVNHRVDFAGGQFFEAGAYHRRNKDDYAFNRFAPLGPVHPFQHTTWVSGVAASGRRDLGGFALNFRGEALADKLESTSLTFGRYHTRTLTKFAVVPEKTWEAADGSRTSVKVGTAFVDTNRDNGEWSPVFELARTFSSMPLRRIYLGYAKTSQVPTYTALNSSVGAGLFRGNPNLGREKSHTVELGLDGALGGWTTQSALFWRQDDALVDWTFRRGVTARTANAVDVEVAGFEAVARRSWAACDVVLGYTALTKNADYRGAAVDASFYALNYARHRLTAALTVRLGHGFELRMDNVARLQADNPLRVAGGDEALNTAVGLSFRPRGMRGLEFFANADNLWDSDFQDVPSVPAAPRQISGGVSYAW